MANKIFILSIAYADLDCGESGLDTYPFSTLEKAQKAMNEDVEEWKKGFKEEIGKWEIEQGSTDAECYRGEDYDNYHYSWRIDEREIDGDVKTWFLPEESSK